MFPLITKLCIRSPELTYLLATVTMLYSTLSSLFSSLPLSFPLPPSFTSSIPFFLFTLSSFSLILCKDAWVFRRRLGTILDAREEYRQEGKHRQPWESHGSVLYVMHKTTLSLKGKLFLIIEIKFILLNGNYRQPIIPKCV